MDRITNLTVRKRVGAAAASLACVAAFGWLASCAKSQEVDTAGAVPTLADARVLDLQATYRATVCAELPVDGPPCDQLLPAAPSDTWPARPITSSQWARDYRLVFVPGLFAGCLDPVIRPFDDVMEHLKLQGFDVYYFQVGGRSRASVNADRLAEQFAALQLDPKPIIVFTYSKGIVDLTEMMVEHPLARRDIAAIVSVAGTVYGSPLADELASVYRTWVAWLPLPGCAASDGDELHDLRPEVRRTWWRDHRAAIDVPTFSLVALPKPDRVSPILESLHRDLAEIDPRNDGSIIYSDAVIPGSYLLGFVNADHLAIALPLQQQLPVLQPLYRDEVPRGTLIEAAARVVATTLTAPAQPGEPDPARQARAAP